MNKLAAETPSILIVFDLLQTPRGADLAAWLSAADGARRSKRSSATLGDASSLRLSPATEKRAEAGRCLKHAGGGELDGVVAKRLDEPYRPGERAMVKVKCLRTADCVVGGFRYATNGTQVGSLLLGLFNDEGKLDHVGSHRVSPLRAPALTRKVEA